MKRYGPSIELSGPYLRMDMSENKLNITILLDGKKFPLQIVDDEQTEMVYRQAAETVNELILRYKSRFDISKNEVLSMVALHVAIDFLTLENNLKKETKEVVRNLQEINHLLDIYLTDKDVL